MACFGLALVPSLFPSFSELRDVGTASRHYCSGVLPHLLPTTGVPACVPSRFADSEDVGRKSDVGYQPFCRESGQSGLSCPVMRVGKQDSRQKRSRLWLRGPGDETRFQAVWRLPPLISAHTRPVGKESTEKPSRYKPLGWLTPAFYFQTSICSKEYIKRVESVFEGVPKSLRSRTGRDIEPPGLLATVGWRDQVIT